MNVVVSVRGPMSAALGSALDGRTLVLYDSAGAQLCRFELADPAFDSNVNSLLQGLDMPRAGSDQIAGTVASCAFVVPDAPPDPSTDVAVLTASVGTTGESDIVSNTLTVPATGTAALNGCWLYIDPDSTIRGELNLSFTG